MHHPKRHDTRSLPVLSAVAAAVALSGVLLPGGPVSAGSEYGNTDKQQSDAAGQQQQSGKTGGQQQAGTMSGDSGEAGKPITKRLPERYKLSTWMGKTVQNADGESLGTVEELVMDDMGRLRYVVMKSQLLADDKQGDLVAVPVGHFVYPLARKDHLVFDATPGQVQSAPSFGAAEDMPDMGQQQISSVVIAYWLPDSADNGQQQQGATGMAEQQDTQQAGASDYDPNRDMINLSQRKSELFEKLDKNDDAAIDRQEAQDHERLSERFEQADTYGNDAITRAEFAAFELEEQSDGASAQDPASGKHGTDQGSQSRSMPGQGTGAQ
ncbi:MAG: PRC-barrel domain-containing protein [Thiohalocapsa sp.]|nr:PRC-barrel domain-containing protein [Thiohalocapsa sp.]